MVNILSKLIGEKKAWKAMEARVQALPPDYRAVYEQIKRYTWKVAAGDGTGTVATLDSVITLFEQGVGRQQGVRDVTGADVAAFCDARLREHDAASYVDGWKASLNADVAGKLAE